MTDLTRFTGIFSIKMLLEQKTTLLTHMTVTYIQVCEIVYIHIFLHKYILNDYKNVQIVWISKT